MLLQERLQQLGIGFRQREVVQRLHQLPVAVELDQLAADADILDRILDILTQLRLLDLVGTGDERLDVAIFGDQPRGGFHADAFDARDVVDAIAHQREDLADLVGADAELFLDFGGADAFVLHRVEHVDRIAVDQLHQILVGRDDGDLPPRLGRGVGVAGDDVVGFDPLFLDAGHGEGAGRIAHQRELRLQVFGWLGTLRLVELVHVVAEGVRGGVEDDAEMRRSVGVVQLVDELPQHVDEAIDGACRHAVPVRERRQHVIGAENEAGASDEVEVILLRHRGPRWPSACRKLTKLTLPRVREAPIGCGLERRREMGR